MSNVCQEVEIRKYLRMLCDRWWSAHRKRPSGGAYKLHTGAVVKSHGIERDRKRLRKISQVRTRKMNESEPLMKHRKLLKLCQNYSLFARVGKA